MHGKANAPEVEPDDGPDLEDAAEKKPSMNRKESKRG
jgi:hypothetical protein